MTTKFKQNKTKMQEKTTWLGLGMHRYRYPIPVSGIGSDTVLMYSYLQNDYQVVSVHP